MSSEGRHVVRPRPRQWADRRAPAAAPGSPPLYAYVLDADDDLAEELDMRTRLAVRQLATARVLEAETGECDLEGWLAAASPGPGLLIIEGLVAIDTRITDRTVTELLGTGDLLQQLSRHTDDIVERAASWRALCPCRLALLDSEFAERVQPWPQIGRALLRRVERRTEDLGVLRAISCQPRLEVRLVLFLWHLAARWGRVEPTGIRLMLPLTHRLLGQLIAAERPSITHALARLSEAGLVSGAAGDWHLHGNLDAHLETLIGGPIRLRGTRGSGGSSGGRIA